MNLLFSAVKEKENTKTTTIFSPVLVEDNIEPHIMFPDNFWPSFVLLLQIF